MYTQDTTLAELIDETLEILYRESERPLVVTLGANALTASATDTTFTLASTDSLQVPVLLENGQELILVTAKSDDATPTYTGARGYAGSVAEAASMGDQLLVQPQFSRRNVKRTVLRGLARSIPVALPSLATAELDPPTSKNYIALPANTIGVDRVAAWDAQTGEWADVHGWQFQDDVPTTVASSKKILSITPALRSWLSTATTKAIMVTTRVPYTWLDGAGAPIADQKRPVETDVVKVPFQALDVVPLFAAANTISNREMTRLELDKVEEWTQDAAFRQGISVRVVQQLWGEYYRALDEARRQYPISRVQVYRRRRNI